ncbi:MAG: xanthine dehydrogenase family protein molybdopterin-binding subunit [Bryobacterales bacterium]|nr:xanthine dehydrogenase family protein molybdopterin-binding subunit [Bryobacterales bacterium]
MPDNHEAFEPERHELREPPAYTFTVTRREFMGAAAGLLITVAGAPAQRDAPAPTLGSRLHISADGTITVLTGKVEVGQGSRTQLAMAAAEEMRVALDHVRVTMADTDLVPNDGITAGSRTTPSTVPAVRHAAAAARGVLVAAAARQWDLDPASLTVRDGAAVHPDGRTFTYAALAQSPALTGAYREPVTATALTAPSEWRVFGTPRHQTNARAMVTGEHRYPSDIERPGMLYGSVLRPPRYGATLVSLDLAAAGDVVAVHDSGFAGCAAPTSLAARRAVEALAATAKWEMREHPSSATLYEHLKANAGSASRGESRGSLETGFQQASRRLRATFHVPYIQHAPMEPRAAVAEWDGGKLTVWTGTQNPFGVRDQLSRAFGIAAEDVRVIVPDSGGGFGGKHTGETAIEAARLAREARRPVSLRWTRAEEFMWAYFRPAGLYELEAGLDEEGRLTAWDFTNYNAGTAALESPYRVAHSRTRFFPCESPLREGSYRGIAATANHFARECFVDELARAAAEDPLDFRLLHLDNPRLRAVLDAAAERFRWGTTRRGLRRRTGIGIACGTEKGSYVAACAEVDAQGGGIEVRRFAMAYECGAILNPSNLLAQVEGSIIQGLGAALSESIEFEGGLLTNGSFGRYRVPRFRNVPPIEIELVNRPDLAPAGAGETPIVAVAPAIANAVSDATGTAVRALPVRV